MAEEASDEVRLGSVLAKPRRARSAEIVRGDRWEGVPFLELRALFGGRLTRELFDRLLDLRSRRALTGFVKITPDVGPWPEQNAVLAFGVAKGVLHEIDRGADERDLARRCVGLGAAQKDDLSLHIDVSASRTIRFALSCRRREHEGDACRAIRAELGHQPLHLVRRQEATARLVGDAETFGHDRGDVVRELAATFREFERDAQNAQLFSDRARRGPLAVALGQVFVDGPGGAQVGKGSVSSEHTDEVSRLDRVHVQGAVGPALRYLAIDSRELERVFQRGFVRGCVGRIGGRPLPRNNDSVGSLGVGASGGSAPLLSGALIVPPPPDSPAPVLPRHWSRSL